MNFLYFLCLVLLGCHKFLNEVEGLKPEKIIGSVPIRRGEFKSTVAIMYQGIDSPDQNPCAGSILSEYIIATVAHCFYDELFGGWRNRLFYVTIAVYHLFEPLPGTRHILVDTVTIPKVYDLDKPADHTTEGNLALVRLAESLEEEEVKRVITRLQPRLHDFRNLDGTFMVSGFGVQFIEIVEDIIHGQVYDKQKGSTSNIMHYAKVKLVSHSDCKRILQGKLAPGNMCAKVIRTNPNVPAGICKYDSGAPLTHQYHLDGIAINSGDISCDEEKKPGIYINVLEYAEFIQNVLNGYVTKDMYIMKLQFDESTNEYMFKTIS